MISIYAMSVNNQTRIVGIYKITCVPNKKIYIGSSIDVHRRWWRHRGELNTQKHNNQYLQNAYNKYGKEAFMWEIIEECCKEQLRSREQHYLDVLQPFNERGYNLCTDSSNPMLGRTHKEETKAKMRHARALQTNTLHRCIIADTWEVIKITQRDIKNVWGIIDYSHFVRHPGHWSKKGLISFVEKEFNGRIYKDEESDQFVHDLLTAKEKLKQQNTKRIQAMTSPKGKDGRWISATFSEQT